MIATIAFALLFSWRQTAEKNAQPLISATNPEYLGCTIWTGKEWTKPSPRSARTPLLESAKGFLAYAEVKVAVNDGTCTNTTTLYIASGAGKKFKIAYTKLPSASDGNGIRLIGWSPSGDRLLAEVNLWKYETDLGYDHVALIYDASTDLAREIPALDEALTRHFGPDCEFELAVKGWKTNEQILVKISRTPESEEYEQHFCVKEPRTLVYDLQKETVQAI
ncbi:MAG: hypothetical protein ACHQLQ_08020 [Candidatus Acidiferrales bacterium]